MREKTETSYESDLTMKQTTLRTFRLSRITHHASRIMSFCLLLTSFTTTTAPAQRSDDKQATFFMGRVKYSSNDGNDCGGVGQDLMRLVSRASTLKIQEERKVKLTDADLFETPIIFMNGHNDFVFVEAELV